MKSFLNTILVLIFITLELQALQLTKTNVSTKDYEEPPTPCYEGCTPWMDSVLNDFQNNSGLVSLKPAVYSGECRELSQHYNPEQTNYAVVMIDQHPTKNEFYFSTIFAYFYPENPFALWNLETARTEMNSYWLENGKILNNSKTSRVEVTYEDGRPAYTYWFRQNKNTEDLNYITYAGPTKKTFCQLKKHLN